MTLNVYRRRNRRRAIKTRVWLNGVEVTHRCFYADGRRGVVRLYKLDENGKILRRPIINAPHWKVPTRAVTEELRGHVRWGRL